MNGLRRKLAMMLATQGGDSRMRPLDSSLQVGDMLFYDKKKAEYVVVKRQNVADVFTNGYDTSRYSTNGDTYDSTQDGYAHFVANEDAMPTQSLYDNTVAATSNYYRIEIDNTQAGSITFSATSGNASVASTTIEWEAGATMADIVALFTAKNASYITFAALADEKGVGLNIGGYGANTMTVTDSSNCTVIDCSTLAFYASENPTAPAVGGTFDPSGVWIHISTSHKSWRGSTAASLLTGKHLVREDSTCYGNTGYNYSYRAGINFVKFKTWASASGDDAFYDDGTGTNNSAARVMRKTRFDTEVTNYTGEDSHHVGMKSYYTHLFTDQTGEYAALRAEYEGRYGTMQDMYDAYLMSHMIDIAANSGTTNAMRNKGKLQTDVKADAMNVTYNYVIIPAYPPEYNAKHYGKAGSVGFEPGVYYHPEPGDIGMFLRDDVMAAVNQNIVAMGSGRKLDNSTYRGSCADYSALYSWYFNGSRGCFTYNSRYDTDVRCRPSLALPLPS